MIQNLKWKWQCRVLLHRCKLWGFLNTLRAIYSFLRKNPHESDFKFFSNFSDENCLLVDIGANSGQSVVSTRIYNRSFSIISFEPNILHKKDLQRTKALFGFNKFEYHLVGLSDQVESQRFFTPVIQGIPLTQEGTISLECLLTDQTTQRRIFELTGQSKFRIHETEIKLKKLDDYELSPDFVKLDVQLSELKVLKGMSNTLRKHNPILIIENGPDLPSIVNYLDTFGYKLFTYNNSINKLEPSRSILLSNLNLFFVPNARMNWLGQLLTN